MRAVPARAKFADPYLGEIARSYNVEPLDDFEAFLTMKLAEIMYAWTPATWESPTAGEVRVGVHPDRVGWTRPFASCLGACDLSFVEASDSERIIQMFVAFHAMVVRDGIDPQVVHTAFLEIDEYRAIVDGIGGAESYEDI